VTEAYRVVQHQSAATFAAKATSSTQKAAYLDAALEATKPPNPAPEWHELLAAPFRYPLPVDPHFAARFRPPRSTRNVLYAAELLDTAVYEWAFHFMRQRIHITGMRDIGIRTAFSLTVVHEDIRSVTGTTDEPALTDRDDYSASHAYIRKHPEIVVLRYPSCRDAMRRPNLAVFSLDALAREIGAEKNLMFLFEQAAAEVRIQEYGLVIRWPDVS